jgi:hypothetical protein
MRKDSGKESRKAHGEAPANRERVTMQVVTASVVLPLATRARGTESGQEPTEALVPQLSQPLPAGQNRHLLVRLTEPSGIRAPDHTCADHEDRSRCACLLLCHVSVPLHTPRRPVRCLPADLHDVNIWREYSAES